MDIPVTNHGTTNLHIAGKVITPGDTRMIDERLVPADLRQGSTPAEPEAPPPNPLADLLKGNVPAVVAALPALSDDDLDRVESLETDDPSPRKGVLEAVSHERLRRAAQP